MRGDARRAHLPVIQPLAQRGSPPPPGRPSLQGSSGAAAEIRLRAFACSPRWISSGGGDVPPWNDLLRVPARPASITAPAPAWIPLSLLPGGDLQKVLCRCNKSLIFSWCLREPAAGCPWTSGRSCSAAGCSGLQTLSSTVRLSCVSGSFTICFHRLPHGSAIIGFLLHFITLNISISQTQSCPRAGTQHLSVYTVLEWE